MGHFGHKIFFFDKKIYVGQFDIFSLEAIFYCLIGHGQIEPRHG